MTVERVGDVSLRWGESARWDDRRQRLYAVDCGASTLHWLDGGEPPLATMPLPGLPTGVVLCDDGRLVVALDDGLHVIDPDRGTSELLSAYPPGLGGRANDAAADGNGNLVTGTLNLAPGPGSYWWFSSAEGWRLLDDGIGNANGPVVVDAAGGGSTLVVADTLASVVHAYPYDGAAGTVGARRPWLDTVPLGGSPDGACADADGGVWTCVLGAGVVARSTGDGVDTAVQVGVPLPTDAAFGGPDLDRLYVTSIAAGDGDLPGAVLVVDGTGRRGRPEPRFHL